MLKTVIKKKKYLPFIKDWEGSKEIPRRKTADLCSHCKNLDTYLNKCVPRNVIVELEGIACKRFKNKFED